MIEVSDLTHAYGARRVLDAVSLRVGEGEVVGLVGPNGAGKTTMMRAIATLIRVRPGAVRVRGHDVCEEGTVRGLVGYLPERDGLYPVLRAWEYLDLFAEIAGHGPGERRRRVDRALAHVGLGDRRDSLTRELSKGLRQRLAIQATLMHDPVALLLDEPTDGLDPESREQVLEDIGALAGEGRAVLLSSHFLDEVDQVSDRAVILVDGRVSRSEEPSTRRFVIRVREDLERARALLVEAGDTAGVTVEAGCLDVHLPSAVPDPSEVVARLVHAGFHVVEVREDRSTLKRRFHDAVEATAGRSGDDA
jgi:ABC-2 type transport system ATP-binding protein